MLPCDHSGSVIRLVGCHYALDLQPYVPYESSENPSNKPHGRRDFLDVIPHICPFWYTATLFRPVESTKKDVNIRGNNQYWSKWAKIGQNLVFKITPAQKKYTTAPRSSFLTVTVVMTRGSQLVEGSHLTGGDTRFCRESSKSRDYMKYLVFSFILFVLYHKMPVSTASALGFFLY